MERHACGSGELLTRVQERLKRLGVRLDDWDKGGFGLGQRVLKVALRTALGAMGPDFAPGEGAIVCESQFQFEERSGMD